MDLSFEDHGPTRIVRVGAARIDAAIAIRFKDAMRSAMGDEARRIVLDLSQVDFVDSSGLGAIVASMKLLGAERRMDLSGLTPIVDKVFRLTRMDTVFDIYPDTGAALARDAA
jgi:anti-anti-sigma factor